MSRNSPAAPLSSCYIATSGRFPGTTQPALQQRIVKLGGDIDSKITADTTLLIASQKDFETPSAKVAAAKDKGIPIVSLDWLQHTESSGARADEKQHLLGSPAVQTTSAPDSSSAPAVANGKKRAASPSTAHAQDHTASQLKKQKKLDDEAESESTKVGDGANAKSKRVQVSVDEYFPLCSYQVYIDDDGLIWDASLNQTNATANNNKFYKVQLLQRPDGSDFKTWTRWGRVGERGQSAMLGSGSLPDAIKNYEKKFRDKSGLKWEDRGDDPRNGKYAYVERNYNPDSDDDDDEGEEVNGATGPTQDKESKPTNPSKLSKPVQALMQLIFNQQYFEETMRAMNYDAQKMPLGKLSKGTISRGFQALKDLAAIIGEPTRTAHDVEQLSNRYYSLIPHDFGRNRPMVIATNDLLKKEIEMLESLSDMKEATDMLKKSLKDDSDVDRLDRQFEGLGLDEMEALDAQSTEFSELAGYLTHTKGATHSGYGKYAVQDIFRIRRRGEFERFDASPYATKHSGNRRLLWHGSRATNFAGILGQGLRIAPPEAPVSGYMFGKGIYLADMSSKSAGYCCHHLSGGTALLLLCEAELGNPMHELASASYTAGEDARAGGKCSTLGKGRDGPRQWKDAGCVHPSLAGTMMPDVTTTPGVINADGGHLRYNEYITYDIAQVRLRYLLRVRLS